MLDFAIGTARFTQFLAAAALFGAPAFLVYAVKADAAAWRWPRPLLIAASLCLALATIGGFLVQTVNMAGPGDNPLAFDTLGYVASSTGFGRAASVRAALAVCVSAILMFAGRTRRVWTLVGLGGFLALGSLAWSGHGAAEDGVPGLEHLGADLVHLWAAGAWAGALVALTAMLLSASSPERLRSLHGALARFSTAGTACVVLLVATGLVNSAFLVGLDRGPMLFTTLYGRLLLIKIALFIAMLIFAAFNRFRLTPRLVKKLEPGQTPMLSALRLSVIMETACVIAILAIVGALGVLAPIATQ